MAFIGLRQQAYIAQQAVRKFCQGCSDRVAGELALRQQPSLVDQAKAYTLDSQFFMKEMLQKRKFGKRENLSAIS